MNLYNDDTRESYVARCASRHIDAAELLYANRSSPSMWVQLFYAAMAEDIYGEHWDRLKKESRI